MSKKFLIGLIPLTVDLDSDQRTYCFRKYFPNMYIIHCVYIYIIIILSNNSLTIRQLIHDFVLNILRNITFRYTYNTSH